MSTKVNRKRMSQEDRARVRASSKSISELAEEYGVSPTTIRRWQSRNDVADRSSRPKTVKTSLTPEQVQAIVALWKAGHWTCRKLLTEVRVDIAPACSMGALCRCLKRHGLDGHVESAVPATHVPVRKDSPKPRSSNQNSQESSDLLRTATGVPRRASNYIKLSPSPTLSPSPPSFTRRSMQAGPVNPTHCPSTIPSGLTFSRPSPGMPGNTIALAASSSSPDYPASTLEKSIDFVVFNHIGPEHEEALFAFLTGNGFRVTDGWNKNNKKWKFARVRCFFVGGRTRILVYYRPTSPYFKTLWVQVMRPTRPLLSMLDAFFDGIGVTPRIRKLELSFDFHTSEPGPMKEFLVSHLYFRHQRSKSKVFKGTFYTNDLRGSANGMRCYLKSKISKIMFARLELHVAKGPIRQLGLKWLLTDLESFDLTKHFKFLEMDKEHVLKTVVGRTAPITNPTGTLRERLKSKIWQRAAESWVRMVEPGREGLMKQVEQMKDRRGGILKHERYFNVIPFNAVFFEAVSKLRFLP